MPAFSELVFERLEIFELVLPEQLPNVNSLAYDYLDLIVLVKILLRSLLAWNYDPERVAPFPHNSP